MLSRVAEKMYWFGRYIERAENTARIINVNTSLIMDLPRVKHIWHSLIQITGCEVEFQNRFTVVDERNVIKFLLLDDFHSIRSAVSNARENARTTREIMPTEVWEKTNELHLYIKNSGDKGLTRAGRHEFLSEIINRCNQLTGLLAGSMSDNFGYNFIKMGRNLERADMTTRITDVGCLNLLDDTRIELLNYDNILWMSVLRSLTGYQMYRQNVQDRVRGEDVVNFLLKNRQFPRAVAHCLSEAFACCELMPHHDQTLRTIGQAIRTVDTDVISLLKESKLHDYIDEIQLELAQIHNSIATSWFGHQVNEDLIEKIE
jgi:uncharacterized alpha-E superfamily protein